ncbi:MAG: hypothetical protein GY855_10070 [candidate division Zixibacteria bacterium]|nr:hypothetical protein [candidate division Zixibacteria bacterium]
MSKILKNPTSESEVGLLQSIIPIRKSILQAHETVNGGRTDVVMPGINVISKTSIGIAVNEHEANAATQTESSDFEQKSKKLYTQNEVETLVAERIAQLNKKIKENKEILAEEMDVLKKQFIDEGYQSGIETGKKQGFDEGKEQGLKEGKAESEEIKSKLNHIISAISEQWDEMYKSAERNIIQSAAELARKTVFALKQYKPDAIEETLKNIADSISGRNELTIKLNTADKQNAEDIIPNLFAQFSKNDSITIITDDKIAQGGCIIETELGKLDATIEKKWEEVAKHIPGYIDEI